MTSESIRFHVGQVSVMDKYICYKLKPLSYAVCIGMFIVVLNGALVTKTGSGNGCGKDWPLCNGKFIPTFAIQSMIEYSHRFITGIVGVLVFALFIYVLRYAKPYRTIVAATLCTFILTLIQAIMGALAVVFTQSPFVLALHFGISLFAFASSFIVLITVQRYKCSEVISLPIHTVSRKFRYGVWFVWLYTYAVIYSGALVRHMKSAGGCFGWPQCNGQWIPPLLGSTAVVFLHRVAAALLLIFVLILAHVVYHHYNDDRELRWCSIFSVVLCLAQMGSGALVAFTIGNPDILLFTSLLHTVLICGLFSLLCYISLKVWQMKTNDGSR